MTQDQEETLLTVFDVLLDELKTSTEKENILECLKWLEKDFPSIEFSDIPEN